MPTHQDERAIVLTYLRDRVATLDWPAMVLAFHTKFGVPANTKPVLLDNDRAGLRHKWLQEEVNETFHAIMDGDLTEIADGLADVIYIALGTALEYGIPIERVFAEVHRTNMLKVADEHGGKIRKPEGWQPPRIAEILKEATK